MFYVHAETGDYPLSLTDIRRRNPNVSFPQTITDEAAAAHGYELVASSPQPEGQFQTLERKAIYVNDAWVEEWIVTPWADAQIAEATAQQWDTVRFERNDKLVSSDWTQMPDSPLADAVKQQWALYRQELRDITKDQTDPFNIQWPTEPA